MYAFLSPTKLPRIILHTLTDFRMFANSFAKFRESGGRGGGALPRYPFDPHGRNHQRCSLLRFFLLDSFPRQRQDICFYSAKLQTPLSLVKHFLHTC